MNARQKCKKLKQRNRLLMNIVTSNPDFLRVFYDWTRQPLNVTRSHVQFKTYAARCPIEPMYGDNARHFAEELVLRELANAIKGNIEWRLDNYDTGYGMLEGRIMIAENGGD